MIQELAAKYEVHPQQITEWKHQFLDNSEAAFERPGSEDSKTVEKDKLIDQLYVQIGQLTVENDFSKKIEVDIPVQDRRQMIERGHEQLSIKQQCQLLLIHRSGLYYKPIGDSSLNLHLMRR